MEAFGAYSHYYDLLYRDKDYRSETDYLLGLFAIHGKTAVTGLLELGCGTGKHAVHLARMGIHVTGVDQSAAMVSQAREAAASEDIETAQRLEFHEGDVRTFRIPRRFDGVCSLFHVMSYQTDNSDLLRALQTARAHLNPGGLFLFDVWYGPAALTDRPTVRVKRLADEKVDVVRIAEPFMHAAENIVDVKYEIIVRDTVAGSCSSFKETHRMRYLFTPELDGFAMQAGFSEVVHSEEWMTGRFPGFDTWGVVFVLRA